MAEIVVEVIEDSRGFATLEEWEDLHRQYLRATPFQVAAGLLCQKIATCVCSGVRLVLSSDESPCHHQPPELSPHDGDGQRFRQRRALAAAGISAHAA